MELIKALDDIQSEYKSLINKFSVKDEFDPITPSKLKELLSYLQNWVTNLKNSVVSINYELNNDQIQSEDLRKYFERDLLLFNKNLQQSLDILTNNRKRKNIEYEKELEKDKQNTEDNIKNILIDKEYFLITSEQNKILLSKDFEDDKRRYDYQHTIAKESYQNIVQKYNDSLASIKQRLNDNYQKESQSFLQDNEELLEKLNRLISTKTNELNSLNTLLNNERTTMKERNHNESRNLNNNIKKISNEKNMQIDKARSQYSKSLSNSNIERENKRQNYLSQSQSLLKDFVTKINEIDETIQKAKNDLEYQTYEIKKDYFYQVYEQTSKYHKLVESLSKEYPNGIPRKKQKLIKTTSRECNKIISSLKRTCEKQLYDITYEYTKSIELNKNNKGYLEIDKNYAIKKLTELEQYDNKYYQEKSNIYESDTSYLIQTANYRFSQKANVLRCQSQKRNKLLERNFNSLEANYYKKIESVQNKINFHNLEIKLTNQLKEIVTDYQEKSYLNDLHYEEVINLLEIEKNKLLNQYNDDKYNLNISSIKQSLDYGYNRVNIQNEKQEKLTELNEELEKLELDLKILTTSLNIEHNNILNKYDKIHTQLKYNEEQRKSKFNYLYSLYYNDIQTISKINDFYIDILSKIQTGHQKAIQILFNDIILEDNKNISYLSNTYNLFYSYFINSYISILECYQSKIDSIIDSRLDFINEFKYKSIYESLDINFNKQQSIIKQKIDLLLDQCDSYKKTIENFELKKYTLENDNEMIRGPIKRKKKKLDSKSLHIVLSNDSKIKEYNNKINDYNKIIQINKEDINSLTEKLKYNEIHFKKEKDHIQKLQHVDSKFFILYKKHIASMVCNYSALGRLITDKELIAKANVKNFKTKILDSQNSFYKVLAKNKQSINYIHDKFVRNINTEKTFNEATMKDELENFISSYEKQKEKTISTHNRNSNKLLHEANEKIVNHKNYINTVVNQFEKKLHQASVLFHKDGVALKKVADNINYEFFKSYYALNGNYDEIVKYHKNQSESINKNYEKLKNQSINWSINQKNILNSRLESLIKTKNEEIESLPLIYKYNTNLYNKETKKKNLEINESIKVSKQEYNIERKRIEKQLSILKQQYIQTKSITEIQHEKAIRAEKKKDKVQLLQSLKSIKVSLESK